MSKIVLVIPEDKQADAKALLPEGNWDSPILREDDGEIFGYLGTWNHEDPLEVINQVESELDGKGYLWGWFSDGYTTASSVYGSEASSVRKLHVPNLKRFDPEE